MIDVVKLVPGACDDSPGFTEDVGSGWNLQCVGYQVGTGVEEDNLEPEKLSRPGEISRRR